MSDIRSRINLGFERLGREIYRRPKRSFLCVGVLCLMCVVNLPSLTINTSTEGFFHQDDPSLVVYEGFREQFGRDAILFVAIRPTEVFDRAFLQRLNDFQQAIEETVPHLHEVTSLINATFIRGEDGGLLVTELLENWPEDEAALEHLKQQVLSYELYQNYLISADGRYATVVIQSDAFTSDGDGLDDEAPKARTQTALTDAQNAVFVEAVKAVVRRFQADDFEIHLAGSPSIGYYLQQRLIEEVPLFTMAAVTIIGVLLFGLFRRASGVIIPVTIVTLSLASTIGLMAAWGDPLTTVTQILPAFIISVGVGASVHLLVVFFQHLMDTGDKETSIAHAMGHSGLPMLLTSLTTAAGLLSFANAPIAPIGDMGFFSAVGVMIALLYTLVLTPAMLALIPLKERGVTGKAVPRWLQVVLDATGRFAANHPQRILLVGSVIAMAGGVGASQLNFSHDPLAWLPENDPLRMDTLLIDKELKGSMNLEIMVDTREENGLYQPKIMNLLDQMKQDLEQVKTGMVFVGKATSVADILKQIHQALNENRADFHKVPTSREMIAQEFLLFGNSGVDDLEKVIDSQYRLARMTLKIPWLDANSYVTFLGELHQYLDKTVGNQADVTITGMVMLLSRTMYHMIKTMISSYLVAGLVITFMMVLLIGNFRLGVLSMIPNFLPIVMGLGAMGFLGFPLDLSSILIGSIAIGLAVDDTVHFMHNFRRYFQETGSASEAINRTLQTTGRAMVFTTLILCSGCLVFTLSSLSNLINFGVITAFVLLMALLADLLLAPALMVIVTRRGWRF